MRVVWRDSVPDMGAPLPPLQPVERSPERTMEGGGKGNGLHRQKCKSTIDCATRTRAAHSKLPVDPCATRSLSSSIVDS